MTRSFFILSPLTILLLAVLSLVVGAVDIPLHDVVDILIGKFEGKASWKYIVLESRLPQIVAAILCGGSLSISGLLLQTAFRNPLAGPSVFGINSGASLGVALVMLLWGGSLTTGIVSFSGYMAVLVGAFLGAMAVMVVILFFSTLVKDNVMLLIVGIMVGYIASSSISLLNFFATDEGMRSYMMWGMGSFASVSLSQLPLFSLSTIIGLVGSLLLVKPLNILLLGDRYAQNLGVNIRRVRNYLLIITGLLTAIATAYCGPVAFIGLVVPHIVRMLLHTDDHRILIPATILCGMVVALVCNLICVLPGDDGVIPLSAVTPIIGAPIIIWVILKRK